MWGSRKNNKGKKEKNKKVKFGKCIFPFQYKWKTHNKCYSTPKGDICATRISQPRRTLKTYGYCFKKRTKKKSLKKKTLKVRKKRPLNCEKKLNYPIIKLILKKLLKRML